jgi:predicted ATPase/DNA-binding CsgD family transcriptional regulator
VRRTPPPRRPLPLQPGPLIGRESLLEEARALLLGDGVRLLTLTGPAGAGKTRLALAVARSLEGTPYGGDAAGPQDAAGAPSGGPDGTPDGMPDGAPFPDGAVFVDLSPLRDPGQVVPAVAAALDVGESGGSSLGEAVARAIGGRRLLLVLDNCEHVLAAAPEVGDLLATCPNLVVLATSRAALHLRWEHELSVPPLDVPDLRALPALERLLQTPAVALFAARAQAVRHDFQVTAENAATIAAVCVRLDGLPLALELAAARTRILDPETLLARLERRLHLLTGGGRDRPTRHQTLRAAIASSYELLAPAERALFRRLAVFAGSAGLEAATAVCAGPDLPPEEVLDRLENLADGSLVRVETAPSRGEARYAMLETVREYAAERLAESGEAPDRFRRHAWYALTLAERAAGELRGPQQMVWLVRLDAGLDDLRAVLGRSLPPPPPAGLLDEPPDEREGPADPATGLRLAAALSPYWTLRSALSEGQHWLDRLLRAAGPEVAPEVRAAALLGAGLLARARPDWVRARSRLEEGLRLARTLDRPRLRGQIASALGGVLFDLGQMTAGEPLIREGIVHLEAAGSPADVADARVAAAALAEAGGDLAGARQALEESLAVARDCGDRIAQCNALYDLGRTVAMGGDMAGARALMEEGLQLAGEIGSLGERLSFHRWLGEVLGRTGELDAAAWHLQASLDLAREADSPRWESYALSGLGAVVLRQGDVPRATALLEEALARAEGIGHPWARGKALGALASAVAAGGDYERALGLRHQELLLWRDLDDRPGTAKALEHLADLLEGHAVGAPLAQLTLLRRGAEALLQAAGAGRAAPPATHGAPSGTDRSQDGGAEAVDVERAVAEALALSAPDASRRGRNAFPLRRPFDLTEREAEVLNLLVIGASDAEIARQLVISVRTANRHVANILSKTGAPNRTAAAALALGKAIEFN